MDLRYGEVWMFGQLLYEGWMCGDDCWKGKSWVGRGQAPKVGASKESKIAKPLHSKGAELNSGKYGNEDWYTFVTREETERWEEEGGA